jgi:hypothetical protein
MEGQLGVFILVQNIHHFIVEDQASLKAIDPDS